MLEEESRRKDSNKKRYVYLNKFNDYRDETEKRFKTIDEKLDTIFDRLIGFTIILSVSLLGGLFYYIFH